MAFQRRRESSFRCLSSLVPVPADFRIFPQADAADLAVAVLLRWRRSHPAKKLEQAPGSKKGHVESPARKLEGESAPRSPVQLPSTGNLQGPDDGRSETE